MPPTKPIGRPPGPGRQFIVLARLLREGEEVPLVLGTGRGRELDLIKGMLREGRSLRITCDSPQDARSIRQTLGRWRTKYRLRSPLLERLRVQDTDGGTVVLAYFMSPLVNPSTGEEHEPRARPGRKPVGWQQPQDMDSQRRAVNQLEEAEEIDRFE